MKQYLDLLQNILDNGTDKESGRPNMPHTWGIEYGIIEMNLQEGFPLLTTKKMPVKWIIHELLWFLRGETNIKYLVDNGINIWNGDAYRWYQKWWNERGSQTDGLRKLETIEEFIEQVKQDSNCDYGWTASNRYVIGDLGKVYGHQWRKQNGVDQIKDVIEGLQKNPYSRYHIVDGWNKADFPDMALPPCHLLYHFLVRPLSIEDRWELLQKEEWDKPFNQVSTDDNELHRICDNYNVPRFYLNLNMYQRSCDTFLGVPFNIASMSLLLMIIAKACNMIPYKSRWLGGDVHLYLDHIPVVKEQIARIPKTLPQIVIKKDINTLGDILGLKIEDFELQNYESDDKLFGELFTGYKK